MGDCVWGVEGEVFVVYGLEGGDGGDEFCCGGEVKDVVELVGEGFIGKKGV